MAESIESYWRTAVQRARTETQLLQCWRFYSGVGSAILVPFAQRELGSAAMSVPRALILAIAAGVGTYFILMAGEFAFRALVSFPAKMWAETQETVRSLKADLQKLATDKWPRLSFEQRQEISRLLRDVPGYFEIWIHFADTADCKTFAADMRESLTNAGWQVPFSRPREDLPSGMFIQARKGEKRAEAFQAALKAIANVDARIEEGPDATIHVAIGVRV
jgi:hypothetical protein